MTVANIDLRDLSEQDLLNQIAAGVPEGGLVDYKAFNIRAHRQ
jgi:hypothetical protein